MSSHPSASQLETKAWEAEIVSGEHTLTLQQEGNVGSILTSGKYDKAIRPVEKLLN